MLRSRLAALAGVSIALAPAPGSSIIEVGAAARSPIPVSPRGRVDGVVRELDPGCVGGGDEPDPDALSLLRR